MIKNTGYHLPHNGELQAAPSPSSALRLQNIADRVGHILTAAETVANAPPNSRSTREQELQQAADSLLRAVQDHMAQTGGPSRELSQALRPLLRSGLDAGGPTAALLAAAPKATLQLVRCLLGGAAKADKAFSALLNDWSQLIGKTSFADQVTATAAHGTEKPAAARLAPKPMGPAESKVQGKNAPQGVKGRAPIHRALTAPPAVPLRPDVALYESIAPAADAAAQISVRSVSSRYSTSSQETTFTSTVPLVDGTKLPITQRTSSEDGTPNKPRFSMVTHAGNWSFGPLVVTHTLYNGSFGKVSLGVDAAGHNVALKSFRTYDSKLPHHAIMSVRQIVASARKATHLSKNTAVIFEAEMTQFFRQNTETHCARYDSPEQPADNALRAVRDGARPFNVYGIICLPKKNDVQKMLMVMDREDGDVFGLASTLEEASLPALALSTAAQLFTECEALHDHMRMGHFDIKMENMLWSDNGQIKHTDYGMAQNIPADGKVRSPTALVGTMITPEHAVIVDQADPDRRELTAGTDVFALSLAVVQLMCRQTSPFGLVEFTHNGRFLARRATQFMEKFAEYRASLFVNGKMTASRAGTEDVFGHFFAACAQGHPEMFNLLMEHALNPDPQHRWPAARIGREVRRLLVAPGAPDFVRLREHMADIADQDEGVQLLYQGMQQAFIPPRAQH